MSETLIARHLFVFHVTGPDAEDFLHRISSQHVRSIKVGECRPSAFLTAGGGVRALFHLVRESADRFLILSSEGWASSILKILDSFHFGEKLEFGSAELEGWELRGEEAPDMVGYKVFSLVNWGVQGWAVLNSTKESSAGLKKLTSSARAVSQDEFGYLRTRFGFADEPSEISDSNIILEAPLLDFVHRNKGCYPGQEVVERIFTYGNVAKRIVSVKLDALVGPQRILDGEKSIGDLVKIYASNSQIIGFACMRRLALEAQSKQWTLELGGEVRMLDTRHNPS